jgi:hypothetical protein
MKLGDLLVEAKFTESDFQVADTKLMLRYRDFASVFKSSELPLRNRRHLGYQPIRGVLAACTYERCLCVFCDARRLDLIERWYSVVHAVHLSSAVQA